MTKERTRLINAAIAVSEDPSDKALAELFQSVMQWPVVDWPDAVHDLHWSNGLTSLDVVCRSGPEPDETK